MQTCLSCQSKHKHNSTHIYCLARSVLIDKKASETENSCPQYSKKAPAAPGLQSKPIKELADTGGRSGGKKKSKHG